MRKANLSAVPRTPLPPVPGFELSHTHFTRAEWAKLRFSVPMTLDE